MKGTLFLLSAATICAVVILVPSMADVPAPMMESGVQVATPSERVAVDCNPTQEAEPAVSRLAIEPEDQPVPPENDDLLQEVMGVKSRGTITPEQASQKIASLDKGRSTFATLARNETTQFGTAHRANRSPAKGSSVLLPHQR